MVTDNSVINAPRYFKPFKCDKHFFKNIDGTFERVCMATPQGNIDTEVLRYGSACVLESKEKYSTNLSDTITIFSDNNKSPLSNVKIK